MKTIEMKKFYEIRELKTDALYAVGEENFRKGILPFTYNTEQDYKIEKQMYVDKNKKTYTEAAINNLKNAGVEIIITTDKEAE